MVIFMDRNVKSNKQTTERQMGCYVIRNVLQRNCRLTNTTMPFNQRQTTRELSRCRDLHLTPMSLIHKLDIDITNHTLSF